MADEIDDIFNTLIARVLSGEATPGERQQLDDWMTIPANAAYFEGAKRAFTLAEKHLAKGKDIPLLDVDEEWQRFSTRVGHQQKGNVRELPRSGFTWTRAAAAVLITTAAAFAINFLVSRGGETHFKTLAETQRVELPDGSVVTLNRNSSLSFDDDFNGEGRSVELTGEAFFDVAPDREKPFVISSGTIRVEVVGTAFNVSAYESDKQVNVTVETGVVRFSATTSGETIELRPGQAGTYAKSQDALSLNANPDVNYKSWSTRHIEFNGTPLQEVIKTLNRTYGSNITIAGTISDNCVVTVTFDQQTLDAVLRVLETTLNLTYRVNGDVIEITSAKC